MRANGLLQITRALAVPLIVSLAGCGGMNSPTTASGPKTATPIQHVIIVIGENRSFDNLFATYVPPDPTQHVENLLSEGIVNADGSPGPNFTAAAQQQAVDSSDDAFLISPPQPVPIRTFRSQVLRWAAVSSHLQTFRPGLRLFLDPLSLKTLACLQRPEPVKRRWNLSARASDP